MAITLSKVPGFNDVSNTPLTAERIALGVHVAAISDNAAFGLVRTEFFQGLYRNGDTIPTPVSPIDGYPYTRAELVYKWGVYSTVNPDTGWISGPDSLWYMNWGVDQATGLVTSTEWYRPWASSPAQSADGKLLVTVIGIRQKDNLQVAGSLEMTYTDLADSEFRQDAPWSQRVARGMSANSKYGVGSAEVIDMGEFWTGKTVPNPVSPIDGTVYHYSNVRFGFSWVWTTAQGSFTQPTWDEGQFAGMFAAIDPSTGHVALSVKYIRGGGEGTITTHTDHGRIRVVAFCDRNAQDGVTLAAAATHFAEVTQEHFYPGEVMQASVMSQVNKNTREAIVVPEFFGPVTYYDGDTIPVPTSTVDGHVYGRAELFYIWDWDSASPGISGHIRTAEFDAAINPSNGKVSINIWRLAPGGPYVHQHGDDSNPGTYGSISVIVVAVRTADNSTVDTHVCLPFPTLTTSSGGSTGGVSTAYPTGTAVKIFGDQEMPLVPVSAMVKVNLTGSNTGFNGGVCNVIKAKISVTAKGSTAVIANYALTFGGDSSPDIGPSGTITSDPISVVLDQDHDYYILCLHFGAEGQLAYNDTAVVALHGKIETTHRSLSLGFSGPPTQDQWYDAPDLSTYLVFPATDDTWNVISAFCYEASPVTPPVDSGSLTADSDLSWLVDGS